MMNRLKLHSLGSLFVALITAFSSAVESQAQVGPGQAGRKRATSLMTLNSRIAQINAARTQTPQIFERVRPFLASDKQDPLKRLLSKTTQSGHESRIRTELLPLTVDLLHSDYREVIEEYPDAFADVRTAVKNLLERASQEKAGDSTVGRALLGEFGESLVALEKEYDVPRRKFNMLVEATGYRIRSNPRLDPAYILAWEDALRNGDWDMKPWFVRIVVGFKDSGSTPVLAEVMRMALLENEVRNEKTAVGFVFYQTLDALMSRPTPNKLLGISTVLEQLGENNRAWAERAIGGRISNSPEWRDLLQKTATDPDLGIHAARVQQAATRYWEK